MIIPPPLCMKINDTPHFLHVYPFNVICFYELLHHKYKKRYSLWIYDICEEAPTINFRPWLHHPYACTSLIRDTQNGS